MGTDQFSLREFEPSDSEGLKNLITEFDGELSTHFQVDPYEAIVSGTEFQTTGVVVECSDFDGPIGMGTVRFGTVQFNGSVIPFAFLDGLKVRKEYRGNGLGYQIANWRIQRARERYGDHCVIATGMLYDNYASHAVATKWCREFAEVALDILIVPARSKPPSPRAGLTVRPLEPKQFEEFASKQGRFLQNYNLNSPGTPESVAHALGVSVGGKKPYRFYAVTDRNGNLVAGTQTWARGLLKMDILNNPPTPLRMMNKVFHLLPPDFTIRDISVSGLWHEPGQWQAARFLWESIRWECKDQGTTIAAGFDPRDPLRKVVDLKPWHQPRPQITLAIHAPELIDRRKLFFSLGRV